MLSSLTKNTSSGCFQVIWITVTLGERIDRSPAMHLTIGLFVPPIRRRSSTSQPFTGSITTTYPRLHEYSGPTVNSMCSIASLATQGLRQNS
jgi:hypothetical protein